jgi:hypothetical protein
VAEREMKRNAVAFTVDHLAGSPLAASERVSHVIEW